MDTQIGLPLEKNSTNDPGGMPLPARPKLPPVPKLRSKTPLSAHIAEVLERSSSKKNHAVLDLEALDHNLGLIKSKIGSKAELRISMSGVPSPNLLQHLAFLLDTKKILVFHPSILLEIIDNPAFEDFDILLGKYFSPSIFNEKIWKEGPYKDRLCKAVTFVVSSKEELGEYLLFANELKSKIKLCLQFDAGSRRCGFETLAEFEHALKMVKGSQNLVELKNVLLLDSHLIQAPRFLIRWISSLEAEHAKIQSLVLRIKEIIKSHGFSEQINITGGGSNTFHLHARGTHLDEICIGTLLSGLGLDKENPLTKDLKPTFFIAHPVSKVDGFVKIPFVSSFVSKILRLAIGSRASIWVLGGGWRGRWLHPCVKHFKWRFFLRNKLSPLTVRTHLSWKSNSPLPHLGTQLLLVPESVSTVFDFNETVLIRGNSKLGLVKNFRGAV